MGTESDPYIASLKGEIRELRAIVDTLPKCNRLIDGKLVCDKPVTPGMEVWSWNGFPNCRIEGPEKVTAIILDDDEGEWLINDDESGSHFFDSREAAEAVEAAKGTKA